MESALAFFCLVCTLATHRSHHALQMVVLGPFSGFFIVVMNHVRLEETDSQSGHMCPAVSDSLQLVAACTVSERILSISSIRTRMM